MPLYKPNPSIGEDDGLHIQALTESLVRMAERAKDYDDTGSPMLLVPLQGLLAQHRKLCAQFEAKLSSMVKEEMKKTRKVVKRATRPITRNPFGLLAKP